VHGPDHVEDRHRIARELKELSSPHVSPESRLVSELFWLYSLLERGKIHEFDKGNRAFREIAEQLRQPQGLWYAELLDGMRLLLRGDFDEAARAAERFTSLGRRANDANAVHSAMAHGAMICFERGDIRTVLPAAQELADTYPSVIVWRAALAWMLALDGHREEATDRVRVLAPALVNGPRRMDSSGALALVAEAACLVGDRALSSLLYTALLPLERSFLIHGLCTLFWGAAARVLGQLAECMGEYERAAAHLEVAVSLEDGIGANPWKAHSQFALARVLSRVHPELSSRAEIALSDALSISDTFGMSNLRRQIIAARAMPPG
jgi:tetratricopeptide (TPR) repeat protein